MELEENMKALGITKHTIFITFLQNQDRGDYFNICVKCRKVDRDVHSPQGFSSLFTIDDVYEFFDENV